jgi:uncharacterized protein YraI
LTNYHVVKGCDELFIYRDGHRDKAFLDVFDPTLDLAVLRTIKGCKTFLTLTKEKIELGEEVIIFGFPLGNILGTGVKVTTGIVSALTGIGNDSNEMQLTAPAQPGSSGGPILNRSGNLIGVVVARFNKNIVNTENVNFGIKNTSIINFLDSHDIRYFVKDNDQTYSLKEIIKKSKPAVVQVICESKSRQPKSPQRKKIYKKTPPRYVSKGNYRVIGVASNDVLNVRNGPGASYSIIGIIPWNGTGIQKLSCKKVSPRSIWCLVKYKNITGWVNEKFITSRRYNAQRLYKVVNVRYDDRLNVRERPSPSSRKLFNLSPYANNIKVERCVRNKRGALWCYVFYNGYSGWVYSKYLAPQ